MAEVRVERTGRYGVPTGESDVRDLECWLRDFLEGGHLEESLERTRHLLAFLVNHLADAGVLGVPAVIEATGAWGVTDAKTEEKPNG